MAGKVYTDPAKWAVAVRRWQAREMEKPILQAMRRACSVWQKLAIIDFGQRGVGRKVIKDKRGRRRWWGISIDRPVRMGENSYAAGLLLFGLAAHQETGSSTLPHKISGKGNNKLVFAATGRGLFGFGRKRTGLVAVKQVNHPGGPVPRHPFARRTGQLVEPKMRAEIQRGVVESAQKAIG